MKPLMLHGHERSITQIKYNLEGDLLFSCSKDTEPNVWYSLNGERLGTFKGHGGAVWCIDVNWESTVVMTGSADNTCRLWDCETGVEKHKLEEETAVRTCGFSYSGNLIMYTTDRTMGRDCVLNLYDVRDENQIKNKQPLKSVPIHQNKVTAAIWGELDDTLITGHDNGDIMKWDVKKCEVFSKAPEKHSKQINDIQRNKDSSMFITASKDTTARLYDMENLGLMKMYKTERPVNSAAISPIRPHVVAGGGQEAMEVTTSAVRQGKFDARFYHQVFEDEFARVKGHFGPINSVAFHPDGKSYSSGGEDGYIRIHNFDQSYFDFDFEY